LNPDFDLLIKSYDVLFFTETKTDEFDELKLPEEYTYFAKHRKKSKKKQTQKLTPNFHLSYIKKHLN
jgi:hypothetical protein